MRRESKRAESVELGESLYRQSGRTWAYTGAVLGGVISVASNVAHSFLPHPPGSLSRDYWEGWTAPTDWTPEVGSIVAAVFWPVALFVVIEIFARTFSRKTWWQWVRWCGLLPVAAIAALVSYTHLSSLLKWYGEPAATYIAGPLVVDLLMVIATGGLIATTDQSKGAKRVEALTLTPAVAVERVEAPAPAPAYAPAPLDPAVRVERAERVERVVSLPSPESVPTVEGITRHRVAQVMAIREAVPTKEERAALTPARCGEILGITGEGSRGKVRDAVRLMDEAGVELCDAM